MTPEQYLPYCLSAIAGLMLLCVVLRLKYRDERDRNARLRQALMHLELERMNRRMVSKPYHARFGGESE